MANSVQSFRSLESNFQIKRLRLALALFLLAGSRLSAAPLDATPTTRRSLDGQVMQCEAAIDLGRAAYRVFGENAVISGSQMEVNLELETSKCTLVKNRYEFVPTALNGKLVNPRGGFLDFQSLEFMVYTPDFKIIRSVALDQKQSRYQIKFTAPVADIVGLLPRNIVGGSDRRAFFIGLLRGQAQLGDSVSGAVQHRTTVSFGANPLILSSGLGTLRSAPPAQPRRVTMGSD